MRQAAKHSGFKLVVSPDGRGWKFEIYLLNERLPKAFGPAATENEAKERAINAARLQGAALGRFPTSEPVLWRVEE